jgi:hypothetical protein
MVVELYEEEVYGQVFVAVNCALRITGGRLVWEEEGFWDRAMARGRMMD